MPNQQWAALSHHRRKLAATVHNRDRNTPGYLCPGAPNRPCGQPINWDLRWPHPYSPSLDHGIELQDGGPILDPDNCWTAHLGCNSSKGASRYWQRRREQHFPAEQAIHIDPATL